MPGNSGKRKGMSGDIREEKAEKMPGRKGEGAEVASEDTWGDRDKRNDARGW